MLVPSLFTIAMQGSGFTENEVSSAGVCYSSPKSNEDGLDVLTVPVDVVRCAAGRLASTGGGGKTSDIQDLRVVRTVLC
jgi:hypothetical protein